VIKITKQELYKYFDEKLKDTEKSSDCFKDVLRRIRDCIGNTNEEVNVEKIKEVAIEWLEWSGSFFENDKYYIKNIIEEIRKK